VIWLKFAPQNNEKKMSEQIINDFIVAGLYEDTHGVDHTSQACIPADDTSKARLIVKDYGIIAGVELAKKILLHVDPKAEFNLLKTDGTDVSFGDIVFTVQANTRALLMAERLILNMMQRMSGIASLSYRFANEVADLPVKLLDTRKTTPLIRFFEKWAVRIGGCYNYRDGLYDWIMIKDNHVDAAGSITMALERTAEYQQINNLSLGVTLEVRNLEEVYEAIEAGGFTRIMFDNFEIPLMEEAVQIVSGKFQTEASGGVKLNTVRRIAQTGVDYISIGSLTHSAIALDMSLKIEKGS